MVGKARRIKLSGIKPVKESRGTPAPVIRSSKAAMDKKEREWQAESDARTLSQAAAVYADPSRSRAARQAAQRLISKQEAEIASLRAVTKKGAT